MRQHHKNTNGIIAHWRITGLALFFLMLMGVYIPYAVCESTKVRVLVLPFVVRSPEETGYLRTRIASVLEEHLEENGATRISLNESDLKDVLDQPPGDDAIRRLAVRYEADQVVWGSFTLIGDNYSLDARLASPAALTTPRTFSVQGQGLENLLNVLKKLSQQIIRQLFQKDIVAAVQIKGNQRLETDAILRAIKTKTEGIYQKSLISQDLRSIYAMGWFDDVRVDVESSPGGKIVIFHVKEKPVIRRISFKGNLIFDDEEIKESLTISTGAILNIKKIRNNIEQIELKYKDKNYHDVKVDYKLTPLKKNQADIQFIIEEGDKYHIVNIQFEGNHTITNNALKKAIKTNEKGFFYWITSSGDFDRSKLDQDTALLRQYYYNRGYIRARVADPAIEFKKDGIHITFKVDEGPQFKVGKMDIEGELLPDFDKEEFIENSAIKKAVYFSREKMREDITTLKDRYGDDGYAYAKVKPYTVPNPDTLEVDITFNIAKGEEVYFEDITISGNTRTRDKVIRRQLKIVEQALFSTSALKRSVRNLHYLGYFDDVKVENVKGSDSNKMDIKIDVTEKSTGMFSFGAGYSSEENMYLTGEISESNLLGRGQTLKLEGTIGSTTKEYVLGFTEPWLFDIPLSFTVEVWDQTKEYDDEYDYHTIGGGIKLGYRLFDYTRGYIKYNYSIGDITITDETNVSDDVILLEGKNITNSISLIVQYDSRDNRYNTTEGSKHVVSFEHAGLMGDIGFNKYKVETAWYWPLYKGLIGMFHAKLGYVDQYSDDLLLPDYEKFYLGGMYSLRGFDYRGVHLTKINSLGEEAKAGGNYMAQFNVELIFPISKSVGLMGVVFYDTGNVYEDGIDLGDRRASVGGGFRWYSPIAPIRFEYGHVLDKLEGEEEGRWEFTLGGSF